MRKKQRRKDKFEPGVIVNQFWPRKAAMEILKHNDCEQILNALERVPNEYREWVRFYLNDWARKAGGLTKLKLRLGN